MNIAPNTLTNKKSKNMRLKLVSRIFKSLVTNWHYMFSFMRKIKIQIQMVEVEEDTDRYPWNVNARPLV